MHDDNARTIVGLRSRPGYH